MQKKEAVLGQYDRSTYKKEEVRFWYHCDDEPAMKRCCYISKFSPMPTCITCSIPFTGDHANDIGLVTPEGPVCKFDCQDGAIKSPEEIFEGGVVFFAGACTSGDRDLATRLTRKNMLGLPYWQKHPFALLQGETATDQEFAEAMAKM